MYDELLFSCVSSTLKAGTKPSKSFTPKPRKIPRVREPDMEDTSVAVEAAFAPPLDTEHTPVINKELPLLTRLNFAVRLWGFKLLVTTALSLLRLVRASHFRKIAPTYTKRYSIRPMLESRIFIPKTYSTGDKLPLYMNIHGGGFALCDPAIDDAFCHQFANELGYCVVSLDYRKAPSYPFPIPVYDCAELVRAVLGDGDLPVDHDKVAIGGFSAGGNLCLGIAQFEDLKHRIKAVVPFYPVTDFTQTYRGEYRPTKDGKEDVLKHSATLFNWAYVPAGTDRRNTLMSSVYATRDMLPQKMYFVGVEYDCLCNEASVLAKNLAGLDEKKDYGPAWSKNGIRWEMVPDYQHGFVQEMGMKGEEEIKRKQVCVELYQRIDVWLKKEVFQN